MRKVFLAFAVLWMAVSHEAIAQERNPATGIMLRPLQEGLSGGLAQGKSLGVEGDHFSFVAPSYCNNVTVVSKYGKLAKSSSISPGIYTKFPVEGTINSSIFIGNYFDHNSGVGVTDWNSGSWAYDDAPPFFHSGDDNLAKTFRNSDKGIRIFAVLGGIVDSVKDGYPDRNIAMPPTREAVNLVRIKHGTNGSEGYTWYGHLRKNSIVVRKGQTVIAGEFLGYMGSSGFSDHPHLHFEATDPNGTTPVDSYSGGSSNDLWNASANAPAYVAPANTFRLIDFGVTNKSSNPNVSFGWASPSNTNLIRMFKEWATQPLIVSRASSDTLVLWWQYQGIPTSGYIPAIFYWNGSSWVLYGSQSFSISANERMNWNYLWVVNLPSYQYWLFAIYDATGTVLLNSKQFEMGASNVFAPRFRKRGESLKSSGTNAVTARVRLVSGQRNGNITFSSPNPSVTISSPNNNDSTDVVIPFSVYGGNLSTYINVYATDNGGVGTRDTCFLHIVNSSLLDNTLPVELVSFKGHWDGSSINLEWETASELNNVGYIIEHSSDKEAWERVADFRSDERLQGLGSSSTGKKYYFDVAGYDPSVLHYFRLTDVDYDGSMESHPAIRIEKPLAFFVSQAYPNPFNPSVNLNLAISASGDIEVKVYDLLGREVESQLVPAEPGRMRLSIDGSSWSSGLYMITVRQGDQFVVRKANLVK